MRRAARVDDNHGEIVDALRAVGARVLSLAPMGGGVPDLLCGFKGRLHLIEVKNGRLSPSRRRLTPDEERFHQRWDGYVHVVCSVPEALRVIGIEVA